MDYPSLIREWGKRLDAAEGIVEAGGVTRVVGLTGKFLVKSGSGEPDHLVDMARKEGPACDCPDAKQRYRALQGLCKHRLAVDLWLQAGEVKA